MGGKSKVWRRRRKRKRRRRRIRQVYSKQSDEWDVGLTWVSPKVRQRRFVGPTNLLCDRGFSVPETPPRFLSLSLSLSLSRARRQQRKLKQSEPAPTEACPPTPPPCPQPSKQNSSRITFRCSTPCLCRDWLERSTRNKAKRSKGKTSLYY
jgi:hypothetical protein